MPAQANKKAWLLANANPQSPVAESYRKLRTHIQFCFDRRSVPCILVTSAVAGEGKTNTACNLAVVYAQESKRVLLIDANLRAPRLHQIFGKANRTGLSQLLGNVSAAEEVIEPTHIEHLSVITAGPLAPNPADLLASVHMDSLLQLARERFDVILLDSPGALSVADAQLLASKCDGALIVVKAGRTKKPLVGKTISQLGHVKANILGIVLNRTKP